MDQIWSWDNSHAGAKPRYDAVVGKASYMEGAYGGVFDLQAWLNCDEPRLNCYDLAGVSQLSCMLLLGPDGSEVLDSRWVFQEPNGYILPGLLYGWTDRGLCNNPFFEVPGKSLTCLLSPDLCRSIVHFLTLETNADMRLAVCSIRTSRCSCESRNCGRAASVRQACLGGSQ